MIEILTLLITLAALLLLIWLAWRFTRVADTGPILEEKHRLMLVDLHDGLNKLGDRLQSISTDNSERLRNSVAEELKQTRDAMQALQLAQTDNLVRNREALLEKLNSTFETLNKAVESRLDLISGKVSERLEE
jgi:DNA recombination protein RmuC